MMLSASSSIILEFSELGRLFRAHVVLPGCPFHFLCGALYR
jgi:hypothetical protein